MFDTFSGFPKIDADIDFASPNVKSGAWEKGGCLGIPEDELIRRCSYFLQKKQIFTHKGIFAETIKEIPKSMKIAMINFDADLYQSTVDALDYLFDNGNISLGTVICFDDWNCNKANAKFGERKARNDLSTKHNIDSEILGYYAWSGVKMVIHNYNIKD